jgi:N-acetylglucosamine-6-sulfatase
MYEASIRAPLIIRGPGVPAGRVVHPPAINVDLAATIVDAANARPGRRLDGVSLLPIARQPAAAARRDVALEALTPLFAGRGFPYPFAVPYYGVRSQRYKYVRWSYGDEELSHLRTDPYELRNRAHDELEARLAAKAKRLRRCAGASCR